MKKEYIAEIPFICSNCGETYDVGDTLFFHKNEKICDACMEQIEEGENNERYSEDAFTNR